MEEDYRDKGGSPKTWGRLQAVTDHGSYKESEGTREWPLFWMAFALDKLLEWNRIK